MTPENRINSALRFHPEYFTDPIPPWILDVLDRAALRDLAVISLDHARAMNDLNNKAIDGAMAIIKRAKV